jgi:hypothetical protein
MHLLLIADPVCTPYALSLVILKTQLVLTVVARSSRYKAAVSAPPLR